MNDSLLSAHVVVKTLKFGVFTFLFCGLRQRNARKFVPVFFPFKPIMFLLRGVVVAVTVVFVLTPQ